MDMNLEMIKMFQEYYKRRRITRENVNPAQNSWITVTSLIDYENLQRVHPGRHKEVK